MSSGRPFLQIPGPTNVPYRILQAMAAPTIDHRSPEFADLLRGLLPRLQKVFGTESGNVILYPASGSGGWESALTNVLAPRDRVLAFNYGHFSAKFADTARLLGFEVDEVSLDWGDPLDPNRLHDRLAADTGTNRYKACLVVHNETSTGVTTSLSAVRQAIDEAGHSALLVVDAVSSLASMPVNFDENAIDVCIAASQKGLMLPPGLAVVCVSERGLQVSEKGSPRSFFDWRPIIDDNRAGFFPYTPATNHLYGLKVALEMLLDEEGLESVYERHRRLAHAVRRGLHALELVIVSRQKEHHSDTVTAAYLPSEVAASDVMDHAREKYQLSLGVGLGKLAGKVLRVGHLGALGELEVLATVGGLELALADVGGWTRVGSGIAECQKALLGTAAVSPILQP